jgi:hypothetical protein
MDAPDIQRFETQAAEVLGAMKELLQEFERRLNEVVGVQRLASSEARSENAKARTALEALARQARATTEAQHQAVAELRAGWQMHVAENSMAAGEEMARRFGEQVTAGLERKLAATTVAVDRVMRRFEWMTALKWGAGIAIAVVLMTTIGVWALMPSVEGLSGTQVRAAMTAITPCTVRQEAHVCAAVEPDEVIRGQSGTTLAIVKGM